VSALVAGWGIAVASAAYRPVGFGSHHWEVAGPDGARWFVTVDELDTKRHSRDEPLDAAFGRLRAALGAARALHGHGGTFAVAPVPTVRGEPVARVGDRFAVALYPFVDGRSFGWGEFDTPAHRRAVFDLVLAVHAAPTVVNRHAMTDGFAIPHRDELDAALDGAGEVAGRGPYGRAAASLVAENAGPIRRLLAHYDELAELGRAQPSRMVLTHGEPHPGNTMLTGDGWRLIDWETALVAPPERDLWSLDPGDGSVLRDYADATGVTPLPDLLRLYRIRWDLADIAIEVRRFRRPHAGSADDDQGWQVLHSQVTHLAAGRTG